MIKLAATDAFLLSPDDDQHICKKFDDITLPLISVSQLTARRYKVVFDGNVVLIIRHDGFVTKGYRDPLRNLYFVPVHPTTFLKAPVPRVENVVAPHNGGNDQSFNDDDDDDAAVITSNTSNRARKNKNDPFVRSVCTSNNNVSSAITKLPSVTAYSAVRASTTDIPRDIPW